MRATSTTKTDTVNTIKGSPREIATAIRRWQKEGYSQSRIAEALNEKGWTTTKGLPWNQTSVSIWMRGGSSVRKAKKALRRTARTTTTTTDRTTKRANLTRIFEDIAAAQFRRPTTRTYLLDLVARTAAK